MERSLTWGDSVCLIMFVSNAIGARVLGVEEVIRHEEERNRLVILAHDKMDE